MDDDFLEHPRQRLRFYSEHVLLLLLDALFMLIWLGIQALYHLASEWIIDNMGVGFVDLTVKLCFDIAFASITFIVVIKTIWKAHKPRRRRSSRDQHESPEDETHGHS